MRSNSLFDTPLDKEGRVVLDLEGIHDNHQNQF